MLGGIGNLPGAALGGSCSACSRLLWRHAAGSPTYRDAIAFVILILILLFRPAGLLGKVQAEKV